MIHCPNCNNDTADSNETCPNCGADLVEIGVSVQDLSGRTLQGKYKVLEKIGQGGMGVVYRVEHMLSQGGKHFALKLIHPHLSQDPMVKKRFLREVDMALNFVHENAVQIRDFGQLDSGELYFTMDFIEGRDLKELIHDESGLHPATAVDISIQILSALEKGHEQGIVHRDIKPDNVLLREDNGNYLAQVLDFGIAKAFSDESTNLTQVGGIVGTPKYMSPEQIQGKAVDALTDLYSVGVVLYEMITGKVPFEGENTTAIMLKHISAQPVSPRKLCPDLNLPVELEQIILKALNKSKNQRFQSAGEFIDALEQLPVDRMGGKDSETVTASAPEFDSPTHANDQEGATVSMDSGVDDEDVPYKTYKPKKSAIFMQYFVGFSILLLILGAIGGGAYLFIKYRQKRQKQFQDYIDKLKTKAENLEKDKKWKKAAETYEDIAEKLQEKNDPKSQAYLLKRDTALNKARYQKNLEVGKKELENKNFEGARDYFQRAKDIYNGEEVNKLLARTEAYEDVQKAETLVKSSGEYAAAVNILESAYKKLKTKRIEKLLDQYRDFRDLKQKLNTVKKTARELKKKKEWKEALAKFEEAQKLADQLPDRPSFQTEINMMKSHIDDEEAFAQIKSMAQKAKTVNSIKEALRKIEEYLTNYKDHTAQAQKIQEKLQKELEKAQSSEYQELVDKAEKLFQEKRYEKAKRAALEATNLNDGSKAYLLLGKIAMIDKEWKKAERFFNQVRSPSPELSLNQAIVNYHLGNYTTSLGLFHTISDQTKEVLLWKARTYEALKQLDKAYETYLKLHKKAPKEYPLAYKFLGSYYANQRANWKKALNYYITFLETSEKEKSQYSQERTTVRKDIASFADYMPLAVGESKTFLRKQHSEDNVQTGTVKHTIIKKNGSLYTREVLFVGSGAKERQEIDKSGGFITITPLREGGKPQKWLKIPPQEGATWQYNPNLKAKIIGFVDIVVNGTKYYNCVRTRFFNANFRQEVWFAPRVGIVKSEVYHSGKKATEMVLQKP